MFNAIESIYYGNLEPMEMSSEYTSKLKKELKELTEIEQELYSKLADEDKEVFHKYREVNIRFNATGCASNFVNGFRLGGKIAVDMLAE